MPIATTTAAGVSIAAALHPNALSRSRGSAAVVMVPPRSRCASALERLVPPLLERGVVPGEVAVVEVDEALALLGAEADALFGVRRDLRVGDAGVVPHVLGEGFLRGGGEHLVQPDVGAGLVGCVLRDDEAGDVERDAFLRRDGFDFRAGL